MSAVPDCLLPRRCVVQGTAAAVRLLLSTALEAASQPPAAVATEPGIPVSCLQPARTDAETPSHWSSDKVRV